MIVVRGKVIATSSTTATLELFGDTTILTYATTTNSTTTMLRVLHIDDVVVMLGTFVEDYFEIMCIRPSHRMFFDTSVTGMRRLYREKDGMLRGASTRTERCK